MKAHTVPCQAWVDVPGGAPTLTTAREVSGRSVRTDAGSFCYASAWPADACTVDEHRITVRPYQWAGMPSGAWSCDTVSVNRK